MINLLESIPFFTQRFLFRTQLVGVFILLSCFSNAQLELTNASTRPGNGGKPLEIEIELALYKIYNINTVAETFDIDGYLTCVWKDERQKFNKEDGDHGFLIYTNERFDAVIQNEIWFPHLEFINTLGKRSTDLKTLNVRYNGKITYVERFHATISNSMDFITFPFDNQKLRIALEPFAHNENEVKFSKVEFGSALQDKEIECDKWVLKEYYNSMNISEGTLNSEDYNDNFSHIDFYVEIDRMSGFYVWQLLFPILIIILTTLVIFWIEDFSTQVGVGFTLMLTVVAFNFYSESLLPKLPYNTYIESIIILGYVFILLCIVAVVYRNHKYSDDTVKRVELQKKYRVLYPVSFMVSISAITMYYFLF